MKKEGKKGQVWGTLIPWIIAALFLVIMVFVIWGLSGKGQGALTYLKNLVRFGR